MATKSGSRALSCIPMLLLFGAISTFNYQLMVETVDKSVRIWLSPLSGALITLGLVSFWGLARGYGRGNVSRNALLSRAKTETVPEAAETIIATGRVRSLSSTLIAPLSGTSCVMYMYRMFYYTVDTRQHRQEVPVYWGYASQAFALDSSSYRYRVYAVPQLDWDAVKVTGEEVIESARAWVASTQFTGTKANILGTVESVFQFAEDMRMDEDGESRRDWKREGDNRDPASLILEETVLPLDTQASAIGTWSAHLGAMIAAESKSGNSGVSIVLVPPENLSSKGLPYSFATYLITAILLTAVGIGMVWFAMRILPTLH